MPRVKAELMILYMLKRQYSKQLPFTLTTELQLVYYDVSLYQNILDFHDSKTTIEDC